MAAEAFHQQGQVAVGKVTAGDSEILIAIVNYDTCAELRDCLESLRGNLRQAVVLNNGSTDGSAEMVRAEYPEVQLLESVNAGYGAGANRVFLASAIGRSARYLILANSDVVFRPGAIEGLVGDLRRHPEAALTGPRLINADGSLQRSCFPLPAGFRWMFDNDAVISVLRFVPGLRARMLRLWDHDREREVPWIKGAVMAMRRDAFEAVGGFNEAFFMYYEETDLCVRLAKAGWLIRFTPAVEVVHLGGASTARIRSAMAVELHASLLRFARIHYSRVHSTLLLLLWRVILLGRLLHARLRLFSHLDSAERETVAQDLKAWRRALTLEFDDLRAGNDKA